MIALPRTTSIDWKKRLEHPVNNGWNATGAHLERSVLPDAPIVLDMPEAGRLLLVRLGEAYPTVLEPPHSDTSEPSIDRGRFSKGLPS